MNCIKCKNNEIQLENLCFYIKSESTVHLMIRYEKSTLLEDRFEIIVKGPYNTVVKCNCTAYLGKRLAIGPMNKEIFAFGVDKITIKGTSLEKKRVWSELYQQPPYNEIVVRDDDSFLGHVPPQNEANNAKKIKLDLDIVFPQTTDKSQFLYSDILKSDKTPKEYQINAYIEALQRDFILVLPTGYGKTLVASIALARMKQLNPDHMILFIVDRVPLVFQQAEAISIDTYLNVCTLTSEFNTQLRRNKLNRGDYDVVVSTAGAYLAIEKKISLDKFCYVIFDECHHAVKKHDYVTILNKLQECEPNRARVLGLTASPPSSQKDSKVTVKLLDEFRNHFFNAPICHDLSLGQDERDDPSIEKVLIDEVGRGLKEYLADLESGLYKLADRVNELSGSKLITKMDWENKKCRSQLITMLYELTLSNRYRDIGKDVQSMKRICKMLDATEMLGVTFANKTLRDLEGFEELDPRPIPSPRLLQLLTLLREMSDDSKIIIFVETRRVASILVSILKEDQDINQRFSPLKIVGQTGPFGMNWADDQEKEIETFRNGNCNLIVSTSVLEEGLDIPACDVVVRFDGLQSLISYKQSMGRARKWERSRFILILSETEKSSLESIQKQESIVRSILMEHHSKDEFPSEFTKNVRKDIKDSVSNSDNSQHQKLLSTECAVEFYLTGTHEQFDIQDDISEIFNEYFLKVKLIEQANCNSRWKSNGLFPSEDTYINLGLRTQTSNNIYERYKLLTIKWPFTLHSQPVWTRVRVPLKCEMKTTNKWPVNNTSCGKFNDKNTFHIHECMSCTIGERGMFELFPDCFIHVTIRVGSGPRYTIEIPLASIQLFILADWKEYDVMLYIPLRFPPKVISDSGVMLSSENCPFLSCFGEYPVFRTSLTYETSNWSQLWILLHRPNTFHVPVYDSRVREVTPMDTEERQVAEHPQYWDKAVQACIWEFNVLKSIRDICLPEETICYFITEIIQADLSRIVALSKTFTHLLSLRCKDTTYYFFDLQSAFNKYLDSFKDYPESTSTPPRYNYCYVECAMVTPSTVIPLQSLFTQCNRLYRMFPEDRFLNLAFREEHGEALKSSDVIDRVKNILINGVVINGVNFYFFVCSGSQLRSKRAIFIHIRDCVTSVPDKLRSMRQQLMGDSIIVNETKYLSRLGLFCTSDHPVCDIEEEDTKCLPDLLADNKLKLTDGNGKIRRSVAEKVFEACNLRDGSSIENTSAIQVRLAGLKGVLTIVDAETDSDFNNGLQHCSIIYRESMKKIEWTNSTLCLVKVGKYNRLCLNTQMMTLLTSLEDSDGNWDPRPRLRSVFKESLEMNARLFTDKSLANKQLALHLYGYSRNTADRIDILSEPYYLSLLRCTYTYNIKNLIKKFHIPVTHGCLLMGIPDPVGVLEDGEVYITYQDPEVEEPLTHIRTGRILVYKNPCLYPGDLLTPTAVDRVELHHLRNVIVFPIRGVTSLPACSGGGDLDGDEFGIIWDENLIPPVTAYFPPLNYDTVLDEYKHSETPQGNPLEEPNIPMHHRHNIQSILAESYCKIISNDLLGIISHYHVAISDLRSEGARDELAIKLAKLASLAVDSPKTGITPTIPDEAKELIKHKGYPDFMEKTESTSYPSEKLLGELYQLAKAVCFETNEWQNILNYYNKGKFEQLIPHNLPLEIFRIPGYECYMEDAKIRYFEYSSSLQRIMLSFGIETEAEVLLSLIVKCHPLLSADTNKVTSALTTAMSYLTEEFREIFERNTPQDSYARKAAAWYLTVYQQQQREDSVFLSFAWIMGKHICDIVAGQPDRQQINLHCSIGNTAREYFMQQSEFIHTNVTAKMRLLEKVRSGINNYCNVVEKSSDGDIFKVQVFGSVSKFLCELESDLDISISLTDHAINLKKQIETLDMKKRRLHLLRILVSPSLENISLSKSEKFNLDFPYITLTMDSEVETRADISVDVSVESDGVLKSNYILQLYLTTGGVFFAFFWILIHWGRHIGILKCHTSLKISTGLVITAEFEALILHIYDKMESKPTTVADVYDNDSSILHSLTNLLMNSELEKTLGQMIEEFFRLGFKLTSESEDRIVYTWPVEGNPTHTISKVALVKISALLFQGWHCLVYTRDIFKLFERVQVQLTFSKRFTPFISDRIRFSTQFYEKSWNNTTGALIKIEPLGRNLLLTAQGSASAIHRLAAEISLLESNSALTRKYKSNANHYMLDGSMLIILSGYPANCRVRLGEFEGACCKQYHASNHKSFLISADQNINTNWKSEGVNRIQTLLWNQLSRFPAKNMDLLNNLKFKTRFGFFYILDGPDSFQDVGGSLELDELEKSLVKGKLNRKIESVEDGQQPNSDSTSHSQPASGDKPVNKPIKHISKQKEKASKSTSSAFCPGLPLIAADDVTQVDRTKSVYLRALDKCGFVLQTDMHKTYTWRVEIQLHFSCDIRVNLDSNLHVVSISERPLIWMLATIVGNRNAVDQSRVHDIRMRSESAKPIEVNSDNYRRVFPDGIQSSLIHVNEEDVPTPCERLQSKMKIIKHNQEIEYYKLDNVTAKICYGVEYCRENFSLGRKFCELSLYHNEEELRDAVRSENNSCRVKSVAANAIDISLKLSESISSFM